VACGCSGRAGRLIHPGQFSPEGYHPQTRPLRAYRRKGAHALCVEEIAAGCVYEPGVIRGPAAELTQPNISRALGGLDHPQVRGEMAIPEDQLAKMTPEQRARRSRDEVQVGKWAAAVYRNA